LSLAVIGTGVMGRGIAQITAQAGIRALLHDSRPGAARDAKESVSGSSRSSPKKAASSGTRLSGRRRISSSPIRASPRLLPIVIEAIVEDLEASASCSARWKISYPGIADGVQYLVLFHHAIAAACKRPERIAGFHFFNPCR